VLRETTSRVCPSRRRTGTSLSHGDVTRVCVYLRGGACVFYYCRTYYKAVRVGGGGQWRTCAMRDDEPRPVWMSLLITHWDP
jgi:hypothetical protein